MKTTKKMIPKWMIKRLHVIYARYGLSEEQYRALILELTDARTDTTKELTYAESQYLAGYITGANATIRPLAERMVEKSLKSQRSAVLKRLQRIGVDTTNWDNVNAFLKSPRIAGKPLYELDSDELSALIPKLESILKKQRNENENENKRV